MRISDVSNLDGQMCIQLINLLKVGRWELSGPDIAAHADTVRWVQSLGHQIGEGLRPASKPDTTMRIKAMGPIGSGPSKSHSKKKKK